MEKKDYDGCVLWCSLLRTNQVFIDDNKKNLERMQEALDAVGVDLDLIDGCIRLSISSGKYDRVTKRGAGRLKKSAWKSDDCKDGAYTYSDIVFLMQTMKDQDIADQLGMSIATYYRRKKKMKESTYFQILDPERLREKEYLESVEGNLNF